MSRIARAAGVVSTATFLSRAGGLVRDAVRASLVGARWLSDAINVAFKVPNLFRDLFAEGAFSGAFVPTLSHTREHRGDAAALELLNRVLSTLAVYVGTLVAAAVIFAPEVVRVLASRTFVEQSGYFELTVVLVRLLAPFLFFVTLAVAAMGALNVFGRFFLPALSPATQNLVLVAGGVGLLAAGLSGGNAALPWAVLLLIGGVVQFAIQVPGLRKLGWRPRFCPDLALRTPEVRRIVRRMLPVAGGLAATQVCILINTRLATRWEGGDSNLYYAFRLIHLPVGLVGVAVGTVVLAEASRRAALGDRDGVRATLGESLMLNLAFAVPACAGLLALGEPLARMLYQWGGRTGATEAAAIGATIRWYALAVIFYCSVKVVAPVFYAQGRVRWPLMASLTAVGANLACALTLNPVLRYRGLALAVGVGQAANLAVLLAGLGIEFGRPGRAVWLRLARIAAAATLCGLAAWGAAAALPAGAAASSRLTRGLLPVVAGGAVYLLAGLALQSPDIRALLRGFRRLDSSENRA